MRKRNTQLEDGEEIAEEKKGLAQALEEFDELVENGGVTVTGRIYRCLPPQEKGFAQPTELCGKVDHFVDEDFVGRTFGSGKYKVRYIIKDADGNKEEKNFIFTVGKEYDAFVKPSEPSRAPEVAQTQPARGGFLDNFLNSLTPEKITAYSLAVKTLKELFAPPPPPPAPDWAAILQIVSATNKDAKPALSDTIVLSAMESMKEKQKQPGKLLLPEYGGQGFMRGFLSRIQAAGKIPLRTSCTSCEVIFRTKSECQRRGWYHAETFVYTDDKASGCSGTCRLYQ